MEQLGVRDSDHIDSTREVYGFSAAHYAHGGLDVRGVDLSPALVETARTAHPDLVFEVASMTDLPDHNRSLTAVVLWYSIIHTPPALLPDVWNELARVVAPNGRVLLGFQAGDNDEMNRENAYGSSSTVTWYRHNSDDVVGAWREPVSSCTPGSGAQQR